MTPSVDGRVVHLEFSGLYDGVSIFRDHETESLWHHISGVALEGPLVGRSLGPVQNVLHTTVAEALAVEPALDVAISERPMRRQSALAAMMGRLPVLGDRFRRTMSRDDTRRPAMDAGVGIWAADSARYYPMEAVLAAGGALVDRFTERRVVVFFSPGSRAPGAFYTAATSARWEEGVLRMNTGETYHDGVLSAPDGTRQVMERPLQLFTRWYGFALTFPQTDVYTP